MHARVVLSLLIAIAMVFASVTTWAAAGVIGDPACCCPDPETCKCHDHDDREPTTSIKRCGGEASIATPDAPAGDRADAAIPSAYLRPTSVQTPRLVSDLESRLLEPETPPF